jgi:hypothetical protein
LRIQKAFRIAELLSKTIKLEDPTIEVKLGDKKSYLINKETIRIHLHKRRNNRGWSVTINVDPSVLPPIIYNLKFRLLKYKGNVMLD